MARFDIVKEPSNSKFKDPTSDMATTRCVTHLLHSRALLQKKVVEEGLFQAGSRKNIQILSPANIQSKGRYLVSY